MTLATKKRLFISCLLLGFSSIAIASEADIKKLISECNQLVKDGNQDKALAISGEVIKQNKSNRDAQVCKAKAQMGLGLYSEATATLKLVEQLSSSDLDRMMTFAMLGNASKGNKQLNDAFEFYQKALDLAKSSKNKGFERVSHELIADAKLQANQYDEAVASYQTALKLAANDRERANIFEHLAEAYEQQSKLNQAIEYQVKAVVAHTHYGDLDSQANAELELGRMYTDANIVDQAESAIGKVHQLAVDNGGAYWEAKSNIYLARLKFRTHQDDDGKKLLASAESINKEVADTSLADLISNLRNQFNR